MLLRQKNGVFRVGTAPGPGNPHAAQVAKLRARLFAACEPEEFDKIAAALVRGAKTGSVDHIRELFDRLFGKSKQPVEIEARTTISVEHLVSVDEAVRLARESGLTNMLPPRLRALAEAQDKPVEVIDGEARPIEVDPG